MSRNHKAEARIVEQSGSNGPRKMEDSVIEASQSGRRCQTDNEINTIKKIRLRIDKLLIPSTIVQVQTPIDEKQL